LSKRLAACTRTCFGKRDGGGVYVREYQGRNFHLKSGVRNIVPAASIVRNAGLRKFVKFSVQNGAFPSERIFDNGCASPLRRPTDV